jgi:hypothetical protein
MTRIRKSRVLKGVLGAVAVLLAGAGIAVAQHPSWKPPMEFNHQVHAKGKVDCLQCHLGIMDTTEHRFPELSTCTGCHKDAPGDNPGKKALAALAASGKPLEWDPPKREPDHVFFPHDIHVDTAGFTCDKCHEEKTTETHHRDVIPTVGMYQCMACHQKSDRPAAKRAAFDCAECHR